MKTKKMTFEDFASNELSRNQKMTILGKGDSILESINILNINITVTIPTTPPGGGGGGGNNGDARISN